MAEDIRVRFACGHAASLGNDTDLSSVCCGVCGERRVQAVHAPPPRIRAVSGEQPDLFASRRAGRFEAEPLGERSDRVTLCGQLAALFKARPGAWIDGRELATVAGAYGWRTRVSDLRRAPYFMTIENRQRRDGTYTISEYRFVHKADVSETRGAA